MTSPPPGRQPFRLDGELPAGLVALEASAGTGKTYALSSLAARFVAERGVPASALCIVSFTEAATAELRARVRSRLSEVHDHLARCVSAAGPVPTGDLLLATIASVDPDVLEVRRRHTAEALAEFDAATITTIHGFCRRVLAGSGAGAGDLDITDGASDIAEAVADLWIARFGHDERSPIVPRRLEQAVRLRLSMPDATMWRLPADVKKPNANQQVHHDYCDATADLVEEVRAAVEERRAAGRRRTFDGLLAETRALLAGPEGPTTVTALRQRTQVMLIDEFQDTDTIQWDIFRRAFVEPIDTRDTGEAPVVVLVGDPKQSIYRFRSAEITAYLAAVAAARDVATLPVNWRSDAPLLTALETLFDGFHFGDPSVVFHRVDAADHHRERALDGAGDESLTLRWVPRDADGTLTSPAATTQIERDVVAVVGELLRQAAAGQLTLPVGDGTDVVGHELDHPERRRRVRPSDIAILTRSNVQASTITRLLGEAGIAAASASNESVLESEAARQWRRLLLALEQPGATGRLRAAAIGWSLDVSARELADLDERALDELHERFRTWAHELATVGLSRLLANLRAAGLHEHVLSRVGGERQLTDFDHVAELLLTISGGRPTTPSALLGHLDALERGVFDPGKNTDARDLMAPDVLARRIDRDDDAVQVLTIHKAKGLEFGVVLCPFLWSQPTSSGPPHAHLDGTRQILTPWITDATPNWAWLREVTEGNRRELDGENRRLLYVALTRARHRLYVWWPAVTTTNGGVLGELLAHASGADVPPSDPSELASVVARSAGTLAVEVVPHRPHPGPAAAPAPTAQPPDLRAAAADRHIDRTWRIWSFSSISSISSASDHPATAERADAVPLVGGTDEPSHDTGTGTDTGIDAGTGTDTGIDGSGVPAAPRALRTVIGGTAFGTMVHEVLERVDFAAPDLAAEVAGHVADRLRGRRLRVDPDVLAQGLLDAIEAPLGGPLGALRLRDVRRADRLDELQFDLPLGRLRADRIGQVLAGHLAPTDPLRPWAEHVAAHGFDLDVEGMLTGSIDLVVRHIAEPRSTRFVVADYKTNQLGPDNPYGTADLVAAMEHHHYPLQAALYLVALHRYLRWKLPDYRPDQHLGGAAYLFVRGMDPGRSAADATGVFWWTPGAAAVEALDRLLAGGPA